MGRKPKYCDEEARKAARALQKQRYNKSERGREARKIQNRRAHALRKAKARSPFAGWVASHLPSLVLDLARQPIIVREWDESLDLSFGLWKTPYELVLPSSRIRMLKCTVEHVNFHHWGLVIERGNERKDMAETSKEQFEVLVSKIDQERMDRLRQWIADNNRVVPGGLDEQYWRIGLCWSARILAIMEHEAEVCRLGRDEYLKAATEHRLAWQNLNWIRDVA